MVNAGVVVGLAGLIIVALVVGALAYYTLTLHGTGKIKTVGIVPYADSGLTQQISAFDWGTIPPGGTSTVTLYLLDNGTAPVTLTFSTTNWQPTNAPTYLSLAWNYNNQTIQPGSAITVDFTLMASPQTVGISTFSFDTIITASG